MVREQIEERENSKSPQKTRRKSVKVAQHPLSGPSTVTIIDKLTHFDKRTDLSSKITTSNSVSKTHGGSIRSLNHTGGSSRLERAGMHLLSQIGRTYI